MTGVAWILLLIGVVFMIGSFFVTEKLSPSELNQIAELSEEELKRIIDRGLKNAESRIEDAIDEQVDQSSEKVDRSLEKVTNDKIMAISEYSDTVIESMNKTHNEIMFLYSMLNDKHTELTGMAADLQRLAADVRSLEEKASAIATQAAPERAAAVSTTSAAAPATVETADATERETAVTPAEQKEETPETEETKQEGLHAEILKLRKLGMTEVQIARKLGIGIGEVRLVNGLYRGESDS
ncbi:DUF6115 domain-containing protein [Roseburia hominis]|uniref:DUF6115 domain-containing protein n=1 Tax=Roseburia hominis TaxID=301301 RepID=UPI0026ED3AA9|nr:DUF6115 domain-containing protein [Roseburia hominis]MCI7524072.1 DUF6115 domain-containing protein [Roseburia hominis]